MSRYAEKTEVTPDRSRAEIERLLQRYGANGFMYGWDQHRAVLGFVANERQIRFHLPLPNPKDQRYAHTPAGRVRDLNSPAAREAYEQDVRQRWRALALVIKAQLEAVAAGIVTFHDAFMPYIVLPSGQTVSEAVTPRIAAAYAHGSITELLPDYRPALEAAP